MYSSHLCYSLVHHFLVPYIDSTPSYLFGTIAKIHYSGNLSSFKGLFWELIRRFLFCVRS